MSTDVIVVQGDPEPDAPSADFAAGAATVVAAAAADVATEAAETASVAVGVATEAVSQVDDALIEAQAAHDRIDRVEAFIEDLVDVLNDEMPAADIPEPDDGAPPPVLDPAPEPEPTDTAPAPKPRRERSGRWGSDGWFGNRE